MTESVDGRSEVGSEGGSLGRECIGKTDVFLLGVTAILSGQVTAWADATAQGFWVLLAATLISTVGYMILTFCVAEMTSALPFSGGIYGFVRAFTSPLLGFIVAMLELIVNMCYITPVIHLVAAIPTHYFHFSRLYVLPFCFIIYVVFGLILLAGGKLFWLFNRYLGLVVLLLFIIYIIGSSTYADFERWGKGSHYNKFDVVELLTDMPLVSTVYLGIHLLPLSSRVTSDPKKDVPIAMNTMMIVGFAITISLICTTCSQYPGIDHLSLRDGYPLTAGFAHIFDLSYYTATCLNIPALFATALGFLYFSARQTHCMAKSGLIHKAFTRVIPSRGTPYAALIGFSSISFLLNVLIELHEDFIEYFFLVTSLSSYIVYICALIAYITFYKKYSVLERYFASPLGIPGAYAGIIVFAFSFIGGIAYSVSYIPGVIIIGVVVFSSFYFIFFSKEQTFSDEERDELFKAYLVNANIAAKNKIRKRGQVLPVFKPTNKNAKVKNAHVHSSLAETQSSTNYIERETPGLDEKEESGHMKKSVHISGADIPPSSPRKRRLSLTGVSRKQISERVTKYLSSKINQILPDPELQLEMLQAQVGVKLEEINNV